MGSPFILIPGSATVSHQARAIIVIGGGAATGLILVP